MTITVTVPELGEGVDTVDVVRVLVEVGDRVAKDQPLVEVETDKAAVEIPSTAAGVVTEVHAREGVPLTAGASIVTLESDASAPGSEAGTAPTDDEPRAVDEPADEPPSTTAATAAVAPAPPPASGPAAPERTIVAVPELGEGVDSVEVVTVLVAVGDRVADGQGLVEVETDKAAVEIPSPAAGTVVEIHVAAGAELRSGSAVVTLEVAAGGSPPAPAPAVEIGAPAPAPTAPPVPPTTVATAARVHHEAPLAPRWVGPDEPRKLVAAAPSVRRFAREVGVDIAQVAGSGPGGRITKDDVKSHSRGLIAQLAKGGGSAAPRALPDLSVYGPVRREAMSTVRRLTAEHLAQAWANVPQVTHHDLADVTDLEELRQRFKDRVAAAGGKLTMTAILVKVAASALRVFPKLNAAVDMAAHEVVFRESVHVGVAVDTEHGLLVPVVRDADRKSIARLAAELDDLAARARARKLKPDELQGGTFTISNLGGIGGTGFSPIVNWPEVAILGVSRGRRQPEWIDGAWQPRLMLPLSLSYDHRLVDGADAARFLRWIAEAIEEPLLLALEG